MQRWYQHQFEYDTSSLFPSFYAVVTVVLAARKVVVPTMVTVLGLITMGAAII